MERIRQLRNDKGLSQAKLAVAAGMDPATLNRLEQGKGNPNLRTLERVANALDVEVTDLLGKAQRRSSLEPSLFNGLEDERRYKMEVLDSFAGHVIKRADYYQQQLERGRNLEYKTADGAFTLANLAVDEFASNYTWLFQGPVRDLLMASDFGEDLGEEIEEQLDARMQSMVERSGQAINALFDSAERLAETEAQRDRLASRRREAEASSARAWRRSA